LSEDFIVFMPNSRVLEINVGFYVCDLSDFLLIRDYFDGNYELEMLGDGE